MAPRFMILACLVSLAACGSSRGAEAERQYETATRDGQAQSDEKCRRARAVAEAYLQDGDQAKYSLWRLRADADCSQAALDG